MSTIRDKNGRFVKGNPGKPKGVKDKYTDLKKAFLEAFEDSGGVKELVAWIKKNPRNRGMFYQMITKLFPIDIKHGGKVEHDLKFDFGENGE